MSYCLNPNCQNPQNPGEAKFCITCGASLHLKNRYRALRRIGQGGFGQTFLAVDEASLDSSRCVIKQLMAARLEEPYIQESIDRFRDEANRLKDLGQHPQIPRLLDYVERQDGQFLIQDYIDGPNLSEILAEEGPFNELQIRELLRDLLPVLQFIHGHRVIHRDIKPQNIIRPQAGGALVLVDFGASKYATGTALARTGTVIGSAGFAAPEQAMGKAVFSSDLYSLGVSCAHLLTGMHPFDLYSVGQDAWIWQHYLAKPISQQLERILSRMVQRSISQRYRTASAVLDDLEQAATPESTAQLAAADMASSPRHWAEADRLPVSPLSPKQPWRCIHTLLGHSGAVSAIAISPNGQWLASGGADRSIKLWDLQSGMLVHTFAGRSLWFGDGHRDRISSLQFASDSSQVLSGSDDGTIKLWDINTRQCIASLTGQGWIVASIALSPDGQLLVSGSADGSVTLWNMANREPIERWKKHRDQVNALAISPDGQLLVSGSYDKTIRVWNLHTAELINTIRGHGDRVSAIALSPDWSLLISGSWDRNLRLWDLDAGELICTLARHTDRVNAIAVNPDGQIFASAGDDTRIYLWHLESGDRLHSLGHSWSVNALAFSPNGQLLASGSADETIKIWQRS
ncbi:MAG: protein kinase domain-containing protein [Elainellaceae cyanobacterium]